MFYIISEEDAKLMLARYGAYVNIVTFSNIVIIYAHALSDFNEIIIRTFSFTRYITQNTCQL